MEKYPLESFKKTLLKRYTSDDEFRPQLGHANDFYYAADKKEYWCVSDAYIAVLIPTDLIGKAGISALKYENVIPPFLPSPVLFTLNEFKQALDKCDSEPGYDEDWKECEKCEGNGWVYESSNEDDDGYSCSECKGEGSICISKTPTGYLAYPTQDKKQNHQVIQFLESKFYPEILNRFTQCIELLQLQDSIIQVLANTIEGSTFISVGEIRILMMPVRDYFENSGYVTKAILPAGAAKL